MYALPRAAMQLGVAALLKDRGCTDRISPRSHSFYRATTEAIWVQWTFIDIHSYSSVTRIQSTKHSVLSQRAAVW